MAIKKIIKRLEEIDRTPAWLCRQVGVHRSIFTRIKNGNRNLTDDMRNSFYKVLGIKKTKRKRRVHENKRVAEKV